jgi:methylenetetrahydrofolate dehydrogenase (NADP+)/methenyltetrahydrofolate cyclohydrolase
MNLLDGKALASVWQQKLIETVNQITQKGQPAPHLAVMLIGENPASQVYVKKKAQTANKIGIQSSVLTYPASIDQQTLLDEIHRVNSDPSIHALLIQLPLPKHLDTNAILSTVSPQKDVDGFHPHNLGKLLSGDFPVALPCTPAGMMLMLEHYQIEIAGKHAVVVGRSNIVGKPIGMLLLEKNATVTYCHSKTTSLSAHLKTADIVIAAVGVPEMIHGKDLKPGCVVLDVGINRKADGTLCGDVHFESASQVASAITPVPGGVGPMTIACLMKNTVALYDAQITSEQLKPATVSS